MMSMIYIFWMYVSLFALIGAMRGWAKELLVVFSLILALSLNHVLRKYIPLANSLDETDPALFWIRVIVMVVMVFFGYQTVVSIQHLASRARSERLQDTLFGAVLGGLNGYLFSGSILYYIHIADYAVQKAITKPTDPELLQKINQMMLYMPPQFLGEPGIYIAIIAAFAFVLIVYI